MTKSEHSDILADGRQGKIVSPVSCVPSKRCLMDEAAGQHAVCRRSEIRARLMYPISDDLPDSHTLLHNRKKKASER